MKHSYRTCRRRNNLGVLAVVLLILPLSAFAQMNYSNWVQRNSTDTTVVRCWNDSASTVMFPPGSMSGMMMNMPDSIYCRIDEMPMDSLLVAHDSTFIGWYRIQIGKDSMNFNLMSYSGMGSGNMMQFYKSMPCHLYWDSLMADSVYHHWRITGLMGWNGSGWDTISNVSVTGSSASFTTSQAYSAVAFVGESNTATAIVSHGTIPAGFTLEQNFPNPFNPTTLISYQLAAPSRVSLKVYDILGRQVSTLVDAVQSAGAHRVSFNGSDLPSGVYFYRLSTEGFAKTMRMVLLK